MKRHGTVAGLAALALWAAAGCKASNDEPKPLPPASAPQDVRAGFEELMAAVVDCDPKRFAEDHIQKAQGALQALDAVADLAEVGLDPTLDHPGARWACTLGRLAGFTKDKVKILDIPMDPRLGTARVIFMLNDREYGFPMMRQFGKWRSPFPGFVFLASEYRDWQKAINAALPDPSKAPDLATRLGKAVTMLDPFQPNWALFPDMKGPTE